MPEVDMLASTLAFTRPDGSTYSVPVAWPYVVVTSINGANFVYYRTAVGELNQSGWWQVAIPMGAASPNGYIFYIWP